MSPREGGLLSLAELLAKEGYGRKSASKSEADHGLAEASLPTSFSNGQTWRNSEPNHGGEPEIRKLYNHRPSRRASKGKRFSDQSIELSEEETSYIYKPCSNLLKYEMPKSGFKSASPPYGKFKVGECSKYLEHDRFEEENLDSWWKSGSLSNEPLIHHKSNVDIKGKTWICYQDKANSPRKICDRFRMKTQKKILKNIRRKSLPVNHTFDDESEINQHKHQECIDGGDTLQESTRYYDQNSVLLNNRVKDFSDSRKHLKPVQSICRRDHELERVEGRALIDHDAFQAVVLVINGYISQFMRDNSFRKTIGLHCYSCLGFDHQIEYGHCDDGFVVNMKRAIDCVERVADGYRNTGELKRAKFQLCVVADLNSDDLKDGFTCGIPNSDLAACAHLYLGILSKIQRKDKVSAKHILQVFCSSPFQARSLLLSELWECLFLPHLLYLRVWYSQEVDCIDNNLNGSSKIKLFDKVYNKLLDNGTYQLAVYYRDWLSNRAECPTIPSVGIPSGLAYGNLNEESHETFSAEEAIDGSCSVQPTITKNLLDAVFGYSSKTNFADEASHEKGKWSFDSCARSLNCVVERNDQADSPSSVVLDGIEQVTLKESLDVPTKVATHGCALLTPHETDDQLLTADESLGLPVAVSVGSRELVKNQNVPHGDMVPEKALLLPVSHGLESDLALKKLAKTVFHLDMQESTHHSSRNVSPSKMDMTLHDLVTENGGTSRGIKKESTFMTTESPYAKRVAVINFLDGLQRQGTINLMHILLVHLQNSPSGQRPLVAALLLHLVVLNEHKSCSIYREEALDAIVEACDCSLTDEKVRVQTCRALLVLEGLFSYGGKALTEAWLLKMARFNYYLIDSLRANENEMLPNDDSLQEHEEKARQKWLLSMGSMFVVNGKKLLWETFSKCLASGAPELGKACLIFVTWLSCALASLSGTQMKLSVFSTLAQSLKECLVNSDRVACRALASLSLLNFIEDLQCRQYFMAFAREAADSLKCISEVTWTAKKLHAIISEEIV